MAIDAPTGKEKPQKYYSSPYLDEVDEFRAANASAAAFGSDPDTTNVHPLTVHAVRPDLVGKNELPFDEPKTPSPADGADEEVVQNAKTNSGDDTLSPDKKSSPKKKASPTHKAPKKKASAKGSKK